MNKKTIENTTIEQNSARIEKNVRGNIEGTVFKNVTFKDCDFNDLIRSNEFCRCYFINCKFNCNWTDKCVFEGCEFTSCKFTSYRFTNNEFIRCKFIACDGDRDTIFTHCVILTSKMKYCNFSTDFSYCTMKNIIVTGGTIEKTCVRDSRMSEVEFISVNLLNVSFRYAVCERVNFKSCKIDNSILPVDFKPVGMGIYQDIYYSCGEDNNKFYLYVGCKTFSIEEAWNYIERKEKDSQLGAASKCALTYIVSLYGAGLLPGTPSYKGNE